VKENKDGIGGIESAWYEDVPPKSNGSEVCEYTGRKIKECIAWENVSSRITILSSRMSGFRFARQTEPTEALRELMKRSHPREPWFTGLQGR
jgi:hypothetical protein